MDEFLAMGVDQLHQAKLSQRLCIQELKQISPENKLIKKMLEEIHSCRENILDIARTTNGQPEPLAARI